MKTLLLLAALICLLAGPTQAVTYTMRDLGTIIPHAVNTLGQVAGTMSAADGTYHAVLWQNGQTTDLGQGYAKGINDLGQVLVCQMNGGAAVWQSGVTTIISGVNAQSGRTLGINNKGQVVGTTIIGSVSQGWIWQNGAVTYMGNIGNTDAAGSSPMAFNNAGQVVGCTINANNSIESWFIWQDSVMSMIPGLPAAEGLTAINDGGQIVGDAMVTNNPTKSYCCQQAFLWQSGSATILGSLGISTARMSLSYATGINNQGQVVGNAWIAVNDSFDASVGPEHAFMWQDGDMMDLGTLGGTYSTADAINDNGWIVGRSETADGQYHAVLWTPVPEPSSMLGILAGLLLMFRRPRARK